MTRLIKFLLAAATAAMLSACAVGGPLEPFRADLEPIGLGPDEIERAPIPEPARTGMTPSPFGEAVFGYDGAKLTLSMWEPNGAPDVVILALHGYGEYGELGFKAAAPDWTARGAVVYAYDQRGFGRNPSRGQWPGADALLADVRAVMTAVRARHPELPMVLMGHSMGGGVALAYLGERLEPQPDAGVLIAPAVLGGEQLGFTSRMLAWLATAIDPDQRLQSSLSSSDITDNPDEARALDADPWYLKQGAPREYLGVIRLMDRAVAEAAQVTVPVLVLSGVQDRVIPHDAIVAAYRSMPQPKTLKVYESGWHLLLRDLVGPTVRGDIIDWIDETVR